MEHTPARADEPGDGWPTADQLTHTLGEQRSLLRGPAVPEVLQVRVDRVLDSTDDLLELAQGEEAREVASRSLAWLAESVGAFQRLPRGFARDHAAPGQVAPVLQLVDELDLLGLTLDHAYDALHRDDADALGRQLDVLAERFATVTAPADIVEDEQGVSPELLDEAVVEERGLEVGDDGIPRLPVPEQPDPHHEQQTPEEKQ